MPTFAASKFKEQCLSLLDSVDDEGIIITKHGRPVAKLIRYRKAPVDLIGTLKNQLEITGDILSTAERWDAES